MYVVNSKIYCRIYTFNIIIIALGDARLQKYSGVVKPTYKTVINMVQTACLLCTYTLG